MISSSSPVYSPAPSAPASSSYSPCSPPYRDNDDDDVVIITKPSSPGSKRALDTEPQLDGSTVPERRPRYRNQLAVRRGYTSDVAIVSLRKAHCTSGAFKVSLVEGLRNPPVKQHHDPRVADGQADFDLIDVFIDNGDDKPLVLLPDEFEVDDLAECKLRYFVRSEQPSNKDDDTTHSSHSSDVDEADEPEWTCLSCDVPLGKTHVVTYNPDDEHAYWCFECARSNHIGLATAAWAACGEGEIVVMLTPPCMFFAIHATVAKARAKVVDFKWLVATEIGAWLEDDAELELYYRGCLLERGKIDAYGIVDGETVQYSIVE